MQKFVELTATFVIQADNLTVQHSILNPQPGQFSAKRGKAFVDVILPRYKIAAAISNISECPEPVMLHFKDPFW